MLNRKKVRICENPLHSKISLHFQTHCFVLQDMKRTYEKLLKEYLDFFLCVAIIGPRNFDPGQTAWLGLWRIFAKDIPVANINSDKIDFPECYYEKVLTISEFMSK